MRHMQFSIVECDNGYFMTLAYSDDVHRDGSLAREQDGMVALTPEDLAKNFVALLVKRKIEGDVNAVK